MPRRDIVTFVLLAGALALTGCDGTEPATGPSTSPSPALASAVAPVWTRVSAGGDHTCALASNGKAYCWGHAVHGQVGNGTAPSRLPSPTVVAGGHRFVQISAGHNHTCAVTADGKAYCWGENSYGEIGDGSVLVHRRVPVPVAGNRRYSEIRAGASFTCGLTRAGKVFCWGRNTYGLLGDGTRVDRQVPVAVVGGLTVRRLSTGGTHTCVVTTTDKAYCWGNGSQGQLGNGKFLTSPRPVPVSGGIAFQAVTAGGNHSCGFTRQRKGYCWGGLEEETFNGQLGNGNTVNGTGVPVPVSGGHAWRQLIAGDLLSCGVTQSNVPFCWGWSFNGQAGNGGTASTFVPTRVAGGHAFIGVSIGSKDEDEGSAHSCGITEAGRIYCWGENLWGQLGNGLSFPEQPQSLTPVQAKMPS